MENNKSRIRNIIRRQKYLEKKAKAEATATAKKRLAELEDARVRQESCRRRKRAKLSE